MKKNYKLALLTVLGLATVTAAHASTTDMLLGFNDAAAPTTAGQSDYVIDLGAYSLFTTTASLNLSSDFSASTFNTAFSADGNAGDDVAVGAVAGNNATGAEALYQTAPNGLITWTSVNESQFGSAVNEAGSPSVGEYASALGLGGNPTTSGGFSQFVAISPTVVGGNSGGSVAANSSNPLALLSSGVATEELFESTGTGQRGNVPSAWTEIGTFDVNVNTDTITFQGVDAVPEPATYGLLAAGGLLFLAVRRQFVGKKA